MHRKKAITIAIAIHLILLLSHRAHAIDPIAGPEFSFYTDLSLATPGLVGSYVDESLYYVTEHDDWRDTQTIAGTRIDTVLDLEGAEWGELAEVGLTHGTDDNWDLYSVQWDGVVVITQEGTRLAIRSDDSSRMWIDTDGDGQFAADGSEFIDNNWGSEQAITLSPSSDPLPVGTYRIRIQYEERYWGNIFELLSSKLETVRFCYLVPSNRTPQIGVTGKLQDLVLSMHGFMADQLERNGLDRLSFRYETAGDGTTPVVHQVQAAETDDFIRADVWNHAAQAAANAGVPVWSVGEVWVLVLEIHEQQPDGSIIGGVALGGSFGSGSDPGVALISAEKMALLGPDALTDETLYDGLVVPEIGPYPLVQDVSFPWFEGNTISSIISSFIGALAHEMSHGFGLPHDFRHDGNFHGNLMGNGLRGWRGFMHPEEYPLDDCRLSHGNALALSTSRYFTSEITSRSVARTPSTRPVSAVPHRAGPTHSIVGLGCDQVAELMQQTVARGWLTRVQDNTRPTVEITTSGPVSPESGQIVIRATVSDDRELASAVLRDWGGNLRELPLSGTSATLEFPTPYWDPGTENAFFVVAFDHDGNVTSEMTNVVPSSANRGPQPFFRIDRASSHGGEVRFDAGHTDDPDGPSGALSYSWDLDGDGFYEIAPSSDPVLTLQPVQTGRWLARVRVTDGAGADVASSPIAWEVLQVTAVDDGLVPAASGRLAVAPNPFNPRTTVSFELHRTAEVTLAVFDLRGRRVATLVDRERRPAGVQRIDWTGLDQAGREVASGLYVVRLRVDDEVRTERLTLVR